MPRCCVFESQRQRPPQRKGSTPTRLEAGAQVQKGVLLEPAAKATIEQFGATTTAYKLTYWMTDPLSIREVSSELKLALWPRFNPEDIKLELRPGPGNRWPPPRPSQLAQFFVTIWTTFVTAAPWVS
jgi:hypothetical protein